MDDAFKHFEAFAGWLLLVMFEEFHSVPFVKRINTIRGVRGWRLSVTHRDTGRSTRLSPTTVTVSLFVDRVSTHCSNVAVIGAVRFVNFY